MNSSTPSSSPSPPSSPSPTFLPNSNCDLSTLASNTAQVSYAQLSSLLTLLPQKDDVERKKLFLNYVFQTRHSMARLLATVRWLKHRGLLLRNTTRAENSAINHTDVFEDVSDALWHSHTSRTLTSTPRPAVASAVDVLTSASVPSSNNTNSTLPSFPTKSDNLRSEKHQKTSMLTMEPSDSTNHFAYISVPPSLHNQLPLSSSFGSVSPSVSDRLAIATRSSIGESLRHLAPVTVQTWRSGPADSFVRIGIESLWAADVSLDNLDPSSALIHVHHIYVYIADHPDSPSLQPRSQRTCSQLSTSATPSQQAVLRSMANNRIFSAIKAARMISSGAKSFNSTAVALCALRDMMRDDVCTPLLMSLLRAQGRALQNGPWASFITIDGVDVGTTRSSPLIIRYWQEHAQPGSLKIFENLDAGTVASEESTAQSAPALNSPQSPFLSDGRVPNSKLASVEVTYDPPLPTAIDLGCPAVPFELLPNCLNLEHLLLYAVRSRIRARLNRLANTFVSRRAQLRINPSCIKLTQKSRRLNGFLKTDDDPHPEDALQIQIDMAEDPVGMDVRIFSMTGGVRVRPYGAAALSMPVRKTGGIELWTGSKQFKSPTEECEAVIAAFEIVRARVKLNAAARSVCALDIGVSNRLPPGTASVAATASPERAASQLVPPFAPLERRAPRKFLTLSPPPPTRDIVQMVHGRGVSMKGSRPGSRNLDRAGPSKRPRLTYATTSDALVFIQESSLAGEDWFVGESGNKNRSEPNEGKRSAIVESDSIDRYNGTASAAATWAVTREVVERRLRRDSLLRAFVGSNVASSAQMPHQRSNEAGDLHLDSASRVLLKVKCEPLPVRRAELLLRGYDAWQVRLSLLPSIFDSTDCAPSGRDEKTNESPGQRDGAAGNLWSVGVACNGSQLTFTYPSANTDTVRSFFRDLTRARTAAALARGVPPSRFYRVLRKSPVRIVVGIGPYGVDNEGPNSRTTVKPLYTARVEYVYSKGNSGGFSLTFSPSRHTMEQLAPYIEEALDASGGQVGSILAGLLERACPVAAAAESAVRQRGSGEIRFATALRARATFNGKQKVVGKNEAKGGAGGMTQTVNHAVDVDARGGSGFVTVIDVGRALGVMSQHGLAHKLTGGGSQRRSDLACLPKWDEIVEALTRKGDAEPQRAGSTVVLRMEKLEQFLTNLVISASAID